MGCTDLMKTYSRYVLIIFNLIFSLTGIIIIAVGVSAKAYYGEFDTFLDKYLYLSDGLIIIGIIIFLIAFFGCCGAIKENACMTTTYSSLLIIIFILEALVGIAGIVLKSKTEQFLVDTLEQTITQYGNDSEITDVWDNIQKQFDCCGVRNYTDWQEHFNETFIPLSCCKIPPGAVSTFTCTTVNVYQKGCLDTFGDYIRDHTSTVEGVGIGLAIIQLLGIVLSCYLAKSIRSDYETV